MAINLPPHVHHLHAPAALASALRAQRLIASDPDAAALALDGALRDLLHHVVDVRSREDLAPDALLRALDNHKPDLARRFRLALRAPHAEAKLAHLWALIEFLQANALLRDAPAQP